jgi:hypothetical protein
MKTLTCVLLISLSIMSAKAQTIILNEDFSGGTLPAGWTTTQDSGSVGWQFGTAAQAVETNNGTTLFAPPSIGNDLAFDLDWKDNDSAYATEDRLITPAIDLSAYSGSKIYFAYDVFFKQTYSWASEYLTVDVSTDNGATWNPFQSTSGPGSLYPLGVWHNCYIDASTYAGQSNVKFSFHYDDYGAHLLGAALGNVQIFIPAFLPTYRLAFEESTGMWCGNCPAGIVYQDSVEKLYPNTTTTIAVHDNDPLEVTEYDSCVNAWPGGVGYPGITINRLAAGSPEQVFYLYNFFINTFGVANVSESSSYNATTRMATINAGADFAINFSGPCNFAVVITEDSVMGNNSSYDQANYFALSGYGDMGNFQNLPNPVPYNEMYYMYVARAILGTSNTNSYTGTAGSIPSPIVANTNYTYQFSYTVPSGYNPAHMHAVTLLRDAETGDILNSTSSPLITTGISELNSGITDADVFPNPVNNNVNVMVNLNKSVYVVISLTDILGRTIANTDEGTLSAGTHNFVYDASALASGIYLVTIKTEDGQLTRKIVKQ